MRRRQYILTLRTYARNIEGEIRRLMRGMN